MLMLHTLRFLLAIPLLIGVFGHPLHRSLVASHDLPDLPEPIVLEGDIQLHKVSLLEDQVFTRVWIYLPGEIPADKKLPCVLIAPAGTRLWHGMVLAEGDRPEHLPYVKAGYAVVAYSISGPVSDEPTDEEFDEALAMFLEAQGGMLNAKAALDYALAKVPAIDPERIYTAGHSSAATLSLQVAASEPRVHGCIAFAPVSDLVEHLKDFADYLKKDFDQPQLKDYSVEYSPLAKADKLKCPLFIQHAEDDQVVEIQQTREFVFAVLGAGNKEIEHLETKTGGHYQSMINSLPDAIEWIGKH